MFNMLGNSTIDVLLTFYFVFRSTFWKNCVFATRDWSILERTDYTQKSHEKIIANQCSRQNLATSRASLIKVLWPTVKRRWLKQILNFDKNQKLINHAHCHTYG